MYSKSICIELGISNISPNFGQTSQKHLCIKLSILSLRYLLSESFSRFNVQNLHAILFFIIFLNLTPFFTFFPQDLYVTFFSQDLCPFPPHQAINERKQATDFLSTRPTCAGYNVGFGRKRKRSSLTPNTQPTRTDADNATGDRAVDDKDPNLKNPNFTNDRREATEFYPEFHILKLV